MGERHHTLDGDAVAHSRLGVRGLVLERHQLGGRSLQLGQLGQLDLLCRQEQRCVVRESHGERVGAGRQQRFELAQEHRRGLHALSRVLGEELHDQRSEGRRRIGAAGEHTEVGGRVHDVRHEQLHGRRRTEDGTTREHAIHQHAQGVEVGAAIRRAVAVGLLGRHVGWRADDLAGAGDPRVRRSQGLRNPEVQDLDVICLADDVDQEDVVGLEIAMNEPERMGFGQGLADLDGDPDGAPGRDRAAAKDRGEGRTDEQLHDHVGAAVGGGAEVEYPDRMRLAQPAGVPRLVLETGGEGLIGDVAGV